MGLGDKLKNARIAAGLSQIEVSEHTGINNKTLSNYECGVSDPDTDNLRALCLLYKISADEIIDLPLKDWAARELYRRYLQSPRNMQEAVEAILGWKPAPSVDQAEEKEKL